MNTDKHRWIMGLLLGSSVIAIFKAELYGRSHLTSLVSFLDNIVVVMFFMARNFVAIALLGQTTLLTLLNSLFAESPFLYL
ncbi:hypothetical protein [Fischerella thermalis]|uniref:hypothetical protein n=1 Tax=Fischerella thermalis TaxID=372787 RepID=UPI000C806B4A|nr:hypothetical protein [Fischerella thermalis]